MKPILIAAACVFAVPAVAQTAPQQDGNMPAAVEGQSMQDPIGGYMPTNPALSGPVAPGARVVFVPNTMTPSQAFPPPEPMKTYPICKAGQTDNCLQRSSARARRR